MVHKNLVNVSCKCSIIKVEVSDYWRKIILVQEFIILQLEERKINICSLSKFGTILPDMFFYIESRDMCLQIEKLEKSLFSAEWNKFLMINTCKIYIHRVETKHQ